MYGVSHSLGVIFEYSILNNTFTPKARFDNTIVNYYTSIIKASDGKLYGTTYHGGSYDQGIIFKYDPVANTLAKKSEFNYANGAHPVYNQLLELNLPSTGIINLAQNNEPELMIFPNPATDYVAITVNSNEKQNISIYDIAGNLVKSGCLENRSTKIDISKLVPATYTIKITDSKGFLKIKKFNKL